MSRCSRPEQRHGCSTCVLSSDMNYGHPIKVPAACKDSGKRNASSIHDEFSTNRIAQTDDASTIATRTDIRNGGNEIPIKQNLTCKFE